MPIFYSQSGNPEVWAEKPAGYFTVEEWQAAHPAPEPTPPTDEELAAEIRMQRDMLLNQTDKYMVVDFPITAKQLTAMKEYREALRKLPEQDGFPQNVTWPTKPEI